MWVMTKHSNTESKSGNNLEQEPSVLETSLQEGEPPRSSYDSRKKAPSKREIMEELSHARFPWDE